MVPQFFMVPDAVVQEGYDPDHPSAKGQVGIVGSNWSNMRDMETLFRDLPLDKTGVVFATYDTSLPTLAMYQVTAENMGFPARNLRGHTVANFYRQACWATFVGIRWPIFIDRPVGICVPSLLKMH
jgi:methylmalonyl-CoA mutase N-terminal domain/subunit